LCDNIRAMSSSDFGGRGKLVGRYEVHERIASGGMASVHFGRLLGEVGFTRVVAVKRLHTQFASDPDFAAMFLDEARIAARIHHPNVVGTLDVVSADEQLFLVMEYVPGESLEKLVREARRRGGPLPPAHAVAILVGVLNGLHAAHEARNASGEWLGIVHRDVSPHNILVGEDGVARLIDFGVAKAVDRLHSTRDGGLRGKIAYMPPEQVMMDRLDRRADIYSAAVVLWELLAGKRHFDAENPAAAVKATLDREAEPPSRFAPGLPPALDAITLRALAKRPDERFATALEMATALEKALAPSTQTEVARWVSETAEGALRERRRILRRIETETAGGASPEASDAQAAASPADAYASWLPGDALQTDATQASQPSSVALETPRSAPRDAKRVGRAPVVVASAIAGALGATLLLVVLRLPRTQAGATASPATPSATATPAVPSSSSAPAPHPGALLPPIASVDGPVASTSAPAAPPSSSPRRERHRQSRPLPEPASTTHRPPLFSRD